MRSTLLLSSFLALAATLAQAKPHGSTGLVHHLDKRGAIINTSAADVSTHVEKRTLNLLCSLLGIGCSSSSSSSSYPSSSWECNGSGSDGYSYDSNKNSCPSSYPSGYKYFGKNYGWLPPKGWSVPSNSWSPYSTFGSDCGKATWWAPSWQWQYPASFHASIPSFWSSLGWYSYNGPSPSWSCSGSGQDGWNYDSNGNSCPFEASGWQYFGKSHSWGPPKGWNVPSDSWSYPSSCLSLVDLFTWWCPSDGWSVTSGLSIPSFWGSLGWSGSGGNGWPSQSWQCDGSGNDGYDNDWQGNSCPYSGQSGFKWFGSNYGWQPEQGWSGASGSWSAPSAWIPTCHLATWWAPQSSWIYPSSLVWPQFWITTFGWSGYNWAPSSFVCNGSGTDGKLFDHLGNGLPSGYPSSWLYFGIAAQWQPCPSFKIPSKTWTPPGSWSPSHATWYKGPTSTWKVPVGWACPSWWSSSFLSPIAGLLSWIL